MINDKESYLAYPQNTIRVIKKYDFVFSKRFGQNFLIDLHVMDKIIRASKLTENDICLEIGPGIGNLTQLLAESAGRVVAVEIDDRLIPILQENLVAYSNVDIVNADFMELDLEAFLEQKKSEFPGGFSGKIRVVANLPYYITTPIIMRLLESGVPVESITVMVQEEVARRMQAGPGTKDYGALSLAVGYYSTAYIDAFVPQNCFIPRPGVGSAVITLTKREAPAVNVANPSQMFAIIKAAFGQRRKTLANALAGSPELGMGKEEAFALIEAAGLDPMVRGETLVIDQFARLSDLWVKNE